MKDVNETKLIRTEIFYDKSFISIVQLVIKNIRILK